MYILDPKAMGPGKIGAVGGVSGKVNQTVQNWWYGRRLGANGHVLVKPAYFPYNDDRQTGGVGMN